MELAVDTGELSTRVSVATVSASRGFEAVFSASASAEAETEVPALCGVVGCRSWRGQRNDSQGGGEQDERAKHCDVWWFGLPLGGVKSKSSRWVK